MGQYSGTVMKTFLQCLTVLDIIQLCGRCFVKVDLFMSWGTPAAQGLWLQAEASHPGPPQP